MKESIKDYVYLCEVLVHYKGTINGKPETWDIWEVYKVVKTEVDAIKWEKWKESHLEEDELVTCWNKMPLVTFEEGE